MTIVPADESQYRKVRRRLTLDLFTRYGPFWADIANLRRTWHVSARSILPPEPLFHAEAVRLLTRYQMPERFHMPIFETLNGLVTPYREMQLADPDLFTAQEAMHDRATVGRFLLDVQAVWEAAMPDDVRYGTNVYGWLTWAPFLSACVSYDPPAMSLLEFADHDDHNAAALAQQTYWQQADLAGAARVHQVAAVQKRDSDALVSAITLLRESYRLSETVPLAAGRRGKPALDDLEAVQAALWFRSGITHAECAERGGWLSHGGNYDQRARKNKNISRVKRGNEILQSRGYSS